jgi:CubicO group peptidase (beta-lactamase class C family)
MDSPGSTSAATAVVHGTVAPGFERVRTAFDRVLADPDELGAAFAVEVDGVPVVDLWGGVADRASGRAWERDTGAVVYSGTKGLAAMCLLLLWDRGLLDDDLPVSHYWPEFGAGKESTTVRQAISHMAGVPGLRAPYTFAQLIDPDGFAALVAAEPPFWPAGTQLAYHAKTFGTIAAQLVRRIDGRSIGRFLAEELVEPFGLDLWLGLPPELEERVAVLERGYPITEGFPLAPEMREVAGEHRLLLEAMMYDPPPPGHGVNWNTPEGHRSQVASSGGIAVARSMAHLYSALAGDGTLDGVRLFSPAAVERAATVFARGYPPAPFDEFEVTFGPGFQVGAGLSPLTAPDVLSVGHGGLGGSVHGAWPRLGVSFSFVMNRLLMLDQRALSLLEATHAAIAA